MLGLWMIILFNVIRLSHETTYTCDPNASCGCSMNSAVVNRIVNGEDAPASTWSWAVFIDITENENSSSMCGGSILTNSWILTAAHCVKDMDSSFLTIFAGSNVVETATQIRRVSQIIMHPNYCSTVQAYDIALLQLSSPLNMSDPKVKRICLPSIEGLDVGTDDNDTSTEWPYPGSTVVAVGWGYLQEGGPPPENLKQVTLQIVGADEPSCIQNRNYPPASLCASGSNGLKDTCQGDSGGPLMLFSPNRQWILVGAVSYGTGCGRPNSAGVYTRVVFFEAWIKSHVSGASWITDPSLFFTTTTTTFPPIGLDGNIIKGSLYSIFIIALLNFFLVVYL